LNNELLLAVIETRAGSRSLDFKCSKTLQSLGEFRPFNAAADYLDNEETTTEYLTAALEDPNPDVFLAAVRDVARTRGMAQLAKDAGLGRESIYKALTPGAKPRYDTMLKAPSLIGYQGFRQFYSSIPILACGRPSATSLRAGSASPIIKRLLCPALTPQEPARSASCTIFFCIDYSLIHIYDMYERYVSCV
jgi:probable addiction module antidote protein